jgi:hypothetical protein
MMIDPLDIPFDQMLRWFLIFSAFGDSIIPFSVIIPVISVASVTSKAGLYTLTFFGPVRFPKPLTTSSPSRISMIMSFPVAVATSNVELGAAT